MSTNNNNQERAMLVDTTKAISSTNSAALVVPMQSNPSLVAPGGKWYMVYVPPGGALPILPLPNSVPIPTSSSSDNGVAVAEATSSSEPQSTASPANSQNADELPRPKRGKRAGKSKIAWRERFVASRQSQMMPRPNRSFYQQNFLPRGYQPRPFCPDGFY